MTKKQNLATPEPTPLSNAAEQVVIFTKEKTMKKLLLIMTLTLCSQFGMAEALTDEKKKVIDELLEITGALKVGEMMGTAVVNQMISAMAQQNANMDQRIVEIVQGEVGQVMHEEFIASGFVHNMSYSIYHKYFSTTELKEMVAFYKTPIGMKVSETLPLVTQESMLAGQKHAQSLGPVIQQRLLARFKKEGIK